MVKKIPTEAPSQATQRYWMALAMFGGGVVCTALAIAMVLIVWLGGWAVEHQSLQLKILATALMGFLTGILMVLVSLAIGGPLGRVKLTAGRQGFGMEAAGDDGDKTPFSKDAPTDNGQTYAADDPLP